MVESPGQKPIGNLWGRRRDHLDKTNSAAYDIKKMWDSGKRRI